MKWREIVLNEFKEIFITGFRLRGMYLFGASLAYLALFAVLYQSHVVNYVPIVIEDQDQTFLSRKIAQYFDDSERFRIIAYTASTEETQSYLQNKTALAAVTIPLKFSQDVKTGAAAKVLVETNAANILVANTVLTSSQEIISYFSKEISAGLLQSAGQLPSAAQARAAPVGATLRVLHNTTLSYQHYFVIGLAMAAFQQGIFLATGAGMMTIYQNIRSFSRMRPFLLLTAKLLPYWLCSLLAFSITLLAACQVFGLPLKGAITQLFLISAVFSLTAILLASIAAAFCSTVVSYTQLSLSYTIPAFILSGYTWPLVGMDIFSHTLAFLFPFTYFADSIRNIMLAGYDPLLGRNIIILLGISALLAGISTAVCSRKLNISNE